MNLFMKSLFAWQAFLLITGAPCAMRIIRSIGFDGAYTHTQ